MPDRTHDAPGVHESAGQGPPAVPAADAGMPSPGDVMGRRAILASGGWIALSTLLPFLATAVLSIVAGRLLGAELLGQQSLIAFAGTLLAALLVNSLTDSCIRTLSAERSAAPEGVAAMERWTTRAHLFAGAVTGTVLAAVGLLREEYVLAWLLLALNAPLDALGWGWAARIVAREGWAAVARRRLATQLLAMLLGVVAVIAGAGIEGIFGANVVATLVLLLALRPLAGRSAAKRSRLPPALVALWGTLAFTLVLRQLVSGRAEIVLLGAFRSGEQIAQYTVAVMLVTSAMVLPAALASAAMPAVAAADGRGDEERAARATVRALRVTAVISFPLAALVVAAGPAFLVALYGAAFAEAGRLSRYVALLVLVVPCGQLLSTYWTGLGRLRLPVLAGVVGVVLDLAVGLALIPGRGAAGAVVATLAGQGCAALVLVVLTWRRLQRPALGLPGCAAAAVSAAAAAACGILAAAPGGLLGAVTAGSATVVVFVAVAAALSRLGLPLLTASDGTWLFDTLPAACTPLLRPLVGR